jgi:hypothetical protein
VTLFSPAEEQEYHLLILREIISTQLRCAGFAIGRPREYKETHRWAEMILKALMSTDPKCLKALLKESD